MVEFAFEGGQLFIVHAEFFEQDGDGATVGDQADRSDLFALRFGFCATLTSRMEPGMSASA